MKFSAENNRYYGEKGWDPQDISLFAEVSVNPKQWLGTAAEHLYAAEVMLPYVKERMRTIKRAMEEKRSTSLNPDLTGIYLFHCALSLENSMKSIISVDNHEEIMREVKSKSKTPKILEGHDLIDLAERINISLNIDQEFALKFLTRYGVWSGKYHQSKKFNESGLTDKLSDGNHYLTGGYNPASIPSYFEFCLNFYNDARKKVNK